MALLAIAVGATVLSGLVTIYYDVPRQMGTQFRNYGANMIFVAADNAEGVFGQIAAIDKTTEASVLWTKNEEIVFLIKACAISNRYGFSSFVADKLTLVS